MRVVGAVVVTVKCRGVASRCALGAALGSGASGSVSMRLGVVFSAYAVGLVGEPEGWVIGAIGTEAGLRGDVLVGGLGRAVLLEDSEEGGWSVAGGAGLAEVADGGYGEGYGESKCCKRNRGCGELQLAHGERYGKGHAGSEDEERAPRELDDPEGGQCAPERRSEIDHAEEHGEGEGCCRRGGTRRVGLVAWAGEPSDGERDQRDGGHGCGKVLDVHEEVVAAEQEGAVQEQVVGGAQAGGEGVGHVDERALVDGGQEVDSCET